MDEIDLAILKELQKDARRSLNEISQSASLSLPAVSERVRKLERSGVIAKYTTVLDPEKFNKTLSCVCFLNLEDKSAKSRRLFCDFILTEPDILSCHCITGQYEYILKIMTESTKSLQALLEKIRFSMPMQLTNTYVILSTIKDLPSIIPTISDIREKKKTRRAKYG